jgi:hypothetical protein
LSFKLKYVYMEVEKRKRDQNGWGFSFPVVGTILRGKEKGFGGGTIPL